VTKTYHLDKPEQEIFNLIDSLPDEKMFQKEVFTKEFISASPPTFVIYMKPTIKFRGGSYWNKTHVYIQLKKIENGTKIILTVKRNSTFILVLVVMGIYALLSILFSRQATLSILICASVVMLLFYLTMAEMRKLLQWTKTFLGIPSDSEEIDFGA
jgi:hypothetical protein